MLKSLISRRYHRKIHTDNPKLFYKLYKWKLGLPLLLEVRFSFVFLLFFVIGLFFAIFPPLPFIRYFCIIFSVLNIWLFFLSFLIINEKPQKRFQTTSSFENNTIKLEQFIRKHIISKIGNGLKSADWKKIKQTNEDLYDELFSDTCNFHTFHYSLEIAKIVDDATILWCYIENPLVKGHPRLAYALVMKNHDVYDINSKQSFNFNEFSELHHLKIYKFWNYKQYSQDDFIENEREKFLKWCHENNVLFSHSF